MQEIDIILMMGVISQVIELSKRALSKYKPPQIIKRVLQETLPPHYVRLILLAL